MQFNVTHHAWKVDDDSGTIAISKAECCASCGKSPPPALKTCTGCKSARYCSVACQKNHRPTHRADCKRMERERKKADGSSASAAAAADLPAALAAARIRSSAADSVDAPDSPTITTVFYNGANGNSNDNGKDCDDSDDDDGDLFADPPPREDCAICFLPLPHDIELSAYQCCCGKRLCVGCLWENERVVQEENDKRTAKMKASRGGLELAMVDECCPFCRQSAYVTDEVIVERTRARMKLNDAGAYDVMAMRYLNGTHGLPHDEDKGFELFTRAAELGSASACYNLSVCYREGVGTRRDPAKERHYLEKAAMAGDTSARHNLGALEEEAGNYRLAFKHWMISARAGDGNSLEAIREGFMAGMPGVTKDDYAKCLRAHKDAKDAVKSEGRERAMIRKFGGGM